MYVKELESIDELFEGKENLPVILKHCICFIKRILCILTITEENVCILPYKNLNNKIICDFIVKIIKKFTNRVVLSGNLSELEYFNAILKQNNVHVHNGKLLSNYLIYDMISYIAKMKNEYTHVQEVFILINKASALDENNIIFFAKNFKRINIITNHLQRFKKIENYLEDEFGIAIIITNNKRKSLAKAGIIINIDFDEKLMNSYNINTKAIILNLNNKCQMHSKLFSGINILDYQMVYDNKFINKAFKGFDKKILYETTLLDKKYEFIRKQIEDDKVKIVNLIGKNGIINRGEYMK